MVCDTTALWVDDEVGCQLLARALGICLQTECPFSCTQPSLRTHIT